MQELEFATALKYLGMAYGKDKFTEEETKFYYSFLKIYNFETLKKAIKNIIVTSKFMPKIAEIIEECEKVKTDSKYLVIKLMQEDGYFADDSEVAKTQLFIENDTVPKWLQEDMDKYLPKLETKKLLN